MNGVTTKTRIETKTRNGVTTTRKTETVTGAGMTTTTVYEKQGDNWVEVK